MLMKTVNENRYKYKYQGKINCKFYIQLILHDYLTLLVVGT